MTLISDFFPTTEEVTTEEVTTEEVTSTALEIEEDHWYKIANYDLSTSSILSYMTTAGDGQTLRTKDSPDGDNSTWRFLQQDSTWGYLKSKSGQYMWYGGGYVQTSSSLQTDRDRNLFHIWYPGSGDKYYMDNKHLRDHTDYRYITEDADRVHYVDWGHSGLPDARGRFLLKDKVKIIPECPSGSKWCDKQFRCIPIEDVCDFMDLATLAHGTWVYDRFEDGLHWFSAPYHGKTLKGTEQTPGTYEHLMNGRAPDILDYEGDEYKKTDSTNSVALPIQDDPDDSTLVLLSGQTNMATTGLPSCGEGYKWCEKQGKCIPDEDICCPVGFKWCEKSRKCILETEECTAPVFPGPPEPITPYSFSDWIKQSTDSEGITTFTNVLKWGEYNIDTMPTDEEFKTDIISKIPSILKRLYKVLPETIEIKLNIFPTDRSEVNPRRYTMGGDIKLKTRGVKAGEGGSGSKINLGLIRLLIIAGFSFSGYKIFLA